MWVNAYPIDTLTIKPVPLGTVWGGSEADAAIRGVALACALVPVGEGVPGVDWRLVCGSCGLAFRIHIKS